MCPASKDVWSNSSPKLQKMIFQSELFIKVRQKWIDKLNKEELGLAATTVRHIWLRRNAFIHGKDFTNPELLVKRVEEEHRAFTDQEKNLPLSSVLEQRVSKWEAPPNGFHKINQDASTDRLNKKIGINVLFRDHGGQVTGTFQTVRNFEASTQMDELYAAMMAATFCQDIGLQ